MALAQRAQYLQRLGVVSYVPRRITPKPVVYWEGPADATLVFVFQFAEATLDWSCPELQLLQKIMDAVRVPACPMALCFSSAIPLSFPTIPPYTRVITFGSKLLKSARIRPIETLHLGELQYNDVAKRALWQAMKEIKAVYV